MRPKPKFSLAPDVIAFIEALMVHGPGDVLGQPVTLTVEERRFLLWAYEVDERGKRIVRRAVRGLAKGSRKTEFAAWVALAEMAGPVRFSHWEDGVARGRPVVDPYVVCAAASYEQADLLFTAARACITEGPLNDFFETFDNEIQIKEQPGVLKRVPAVAGTNDGLRPTFVVADEVHEWTGNKARVHLVLENGLAKREGAWSLSITTAGNPKQSSVGLTLYEYGKKVESGELDDPGMLFAWREPKVNLDDLQVQEVREAALVAANPESWKRIDVLMHRYHEVPLLEFCR